MNGKKLSIMLLFALVFLVCFGSVALAKDLPKTKKIKINLEGCDETVTLKLAKDKKERFAIYYDTNFELKRKENSLTITNDSDEAPAYITISVIPDKTAKSCYDEAKRKKKNIYDSGKSTDGYFISTEFEDDDEYYIYDSYEWIDDKNGGCFEIFIKVHDAHHIIFLFLSEGQYKQILLLRYGRKTRLQ